MKFLLTFLGLRALLASKLGIVVLMLPGVIWIAFGIAAKAPHITVLNLFFVASALLLAKRFVRTH